MLSLGPFLQGNTWSAAFKATGNFQNFVSSEENYNKLKMREVARHVTPEAREVAECLAKQKYLQKFNEELIIPQFLKMIGKWPFYLSCPIFALHVPIEVKKSKMRALHEDISNFKSIFDNKVSVTNIFTTCKLLFIIYCKPLTGISSYVAGKISVIKLRRHVYDDKVRILIKEIFASESTPRPSPVQDGVNQAAASYASPSSTRPAIVTTDLSPNMATSSGGKRNLTDDVDFRAKKPRGGGASNMKK